VVGISGRDGATLNPEQPDQAKHGSDSGRDQQTPDPVSTHHCVLRTKGSRSPGVMVTSCHSKPAAESARGTLAL